MVGPFPPANTLFLYNYRLQSDRDSGASIPFLVVVFIPCRIHQLWFPDHDLGSIGERGPVRFGMQPSRSISTRGQTRSGNRVRT